VVQLLVDGIAVATGQLEDIAAAELEDFSEEAADLAGPFLVAVAAELEQNPEAGDLEGPFSAAAAAAAAAVAAVAAVAPLAVAALAAAVHTVVQQPFSVQPWPPAPQFPGLVAGAEETKEKDLGEELKKKSLNGYTLFLTFPKSLFCI